MSMIGVKKAARIRAIHAACRANGIDADARHDLQLALTGKASLSEMDFSEVTRVLDHLNRRSNAGAEWKFVFRLTSDRQVYGRKIYRLAERIGALQTPPVAIISKAYIEGITKQMRGTEQPLEFCDCEQLRKVVQALEVYVKRHGV
ncbi:phage protein GemA/Gp16 family protein [Azonexus sp.]|uniref:phage protein GemA/Gp16 family protein n=1 Tax=Azonexus sp. TaxID=1872668 RepID=UPI0027BA8EB7|nr:phage protein GemA/Gp16 family protein [Azonexus sp.]